MEVAMSLPVRTFTVMSVIEDENTSAWLLLRESRYYCQTEVEKVLQMEITDQEDERPDDPERLKEKIWVGTWELAKRLNLLLDENELDQLDRIPFCV